MPEHVRILSETKLATDMKKILAATGALAMGATTLPAQMYMEDLSMSVTFGWESEYVFRGIQRAEEIYAPSIDFSMGGAYAGVWAALPVDDDGVLGGGNEIDFYAGYGMALSDLLSMDVGVTYYTYNSTPSGSLLTREDTVEVYVGAALDTILNPAFYVYYDIDLENFTLELSGGHSVPLTEVLSLDIGAYVGWVTLEGFDTRGNTGVSRTIFDDDYLYYGASLDLVYSLSENASISVGGRYAARDTALLNGPDFNDIDDILTDGDKDTVWWGVAFTAGF